MRMIDKNGNRTVGRLMRYNMFLWIMLSLLGCAITAYADVSPSNQIISNQLAIEHVVWNKTPISFEVPVSKERMILFPENVSLHNSDSTLTTDKVSILNNAGTLYIKAKKAFDPVRVAVVLNQTGEVVLVDLSAKTTADNIPVQVILSDKSGDAGNDQKPQSDNNAAPVSYAGLMRYAIQHLYAPERLIEDNANIHRTPMYTTRSVHLIYGDKAIAMPLISWRGGDLYITAVLLKNIIRQRVYLNPNDIQGKWLAASFYPMNYLTSKGSNRDRTTLLLISNRPFNEALNSMRGYR